MNSSGVDVTPGACVGGDQVKELLPPTRVHWEEPRVTLKTHLRGHLQQLSAIIAVTFRCSHWAPRLPHKDFLGNLQQTHVHGWNGVESPLRVKHSHGSTSVFMCGHETSA